MLDSIVLESRDGFLIDGIHFPLSWNTGDRAVMMRGRYLIKMFDRIREELGTGGEAIVFEQGLSYGKETWTDFKSRLGAEFMRSNLQEVLKVYQALDWFRLEGIKRSVADQTVTILTSGSFECEGRKSRRHYSDFVRGHLCGALTAILGQEMACEEAKCIAAGDKRCEFVLRPTAHVGQLAEPTSILAQ